MTNSLPANPNITRLKKQAKKLLKQYRENNPEAIAHVQSLHPKPQNFNNLRSAQLVVARSYGFKDWNDLSNSVAVAAFEDKSLAEKAETFIRLGCSQYASNDSLLNYQRAMALLSRYPEISDFSFYTALVANNFNAVQRHLEKDPQQVNALGGPLNWQPLMYLCYGRIAEDKNLRHSIAIVQLLLDNGADPNAHMILNDTYRFTALTGAMGEGEAGVNQPPHQYAEELAVMLLEHGANPNDAQGLYDTMFTASGDKWLALLIKHGLNATHKINWDDADNNSAQTTFDYLLTTSVDRGFSERIAMLLAAGANPNAINGYNGRHAHTNALLKGHKQIAEMLETAGAKRQILPLEDQFRLACVNSDKLEINSLLLQQPQLKADASLLHDAASHCSRQIFHLLIESGFDVNGQANYGRTVLHHFAAENDIEQVSYLLDNGAQIDIRDDSYKAAAIGFAAYNGANNVARLLLDRSDNFLDVVCCAYLERAKVLLTQDPKLVHQRSPLGNTPLHVIGFWLSEQPADETYKHFVELLLGTGADGNAKNNEGQTAVEFCLANGAETLADILGEHIS